MRRLRLTCRHFAWRGHEVFLADCIQLPLARFSSVVKKYFVVPQPVDGADQYVKALEGIVEANQIELLIPTCEGYTPSQVDCIGSLHRRVFSVVRLPSLNRLHNKWFCEVGT